MGGTGISVSRLCFGALTIGPLQANLSVEKGASVIAKAIEGGVNFIDTAELYGTSRAIAKAIRQTGAGDVVIATKSYAYSAQTAEDSVRKALNELERDYIDVYLLHEQESMHTLKGHWEALERLLRFKEQGIIRAVGLSTHHIAAVKAANRIPEIEVLHPLLNVQGLGIQDGTAEAMVQQLTISKAMNKGIYGMKPLGGGNLIASAEACLRWALDLGCLDAIAVGMQYNDEVEANLGFFNTGAFPDSAITQLRAKQRKLLIHEWCNGCGACVQRCGTNALSLEDGRAVVARDKCVLCGYCSAVCVNMCIKVI